MYDPFAPPQLPQQGQMHTMGAPQQVGMVPGVPGSMGLNPGMGGPITGQQNPGGPQMYPGGNPGGAPLQGPSGNNALGPFGPQAQAWMQNHPQFQGFWQQLQDWRGQRPDRQTYTGNDWRGAIQDWRQQRPSWQSLVGASGGGTPGMMPPVSQQGWRTTPGGTGTGSGF